MFPTAWNFSDRVESGHIMSLTPGTRLGAFTIGPALGAEGMGEVYRATDNNLGREDRSRSRERSGCCLRC